MGLKPIYQLPKFYEYAFRVVGDGVACLSCRSSAAKLLKSLAALGEETSMGVRRRAARAPNRSTCAMDRSFGSETRRSADQPVRPQEALTQRFLTAAAEGVGPIRSSDISPETLAPVAGANPSVGAKR